MNWRENLPYLEPPSRAVAISQNNAVPLRYLVDYNIASGQYATTSEPIQLRYHLPYVIYRDYADYWNQVLLYAVNNPLSPSLEAFTNWDFIYPIYGQYQVELEYVLPGKETPNSTFSYQLPYRLGNQ